MIYRHIAKGLSWRLFAAFDTFVVTACVLYWRNGTIDGAMSVVAGIVSMELATKTFLFTVHERLWHVLGWNPR